MTNDVVLMNSVHFSFGGRIILHDINISLKKGTFTGIIGPNGAGKTTLLKLILGLLKPDSGSIKLLGKSPWGRGNNRRYVGYLPQRHQFDYRFPVSVFDVVLMGRFSRIGIFKFPSSKDKKEVLKSLDLAGLPKDIASRHFMELSGGQQQLVFLARALSGNPRLLVLDEPTNGLDSKAQNRFFRTLSDLKKELNITTIVISHDIITISTYADELICINKKVFVKGSPENVINSPITRMAYGFGGVNAPGSFSGAGGERRLLHG